MGDACDVCIAVTELGKDDLDGSIRWNEMRTLTNAAFAVGMVDGGLTNVLMVILFAVDGIRLGK